MPRPKRLSMLLNEVCILHLLELNEENLNSNINQRKDLTVTKI